MPRKTYAREFKLQALKMLTDQGLSVAEVARRLGVTDGCLRAWKMAAAERGESAFPGPGNPTPAADELRRLRAEVLLDCINEVTESQDKFQGLPKGARAVQIADGNVNTYFLTTFGRATRATVCSCEVKTEPNLSQALHLLNGSTTQDKIANGGLTKRLLREQKAPDEIIDQLYLRCLARPPTAGEKTKLTAYLKEPAQNEQVLNDVFWSLLNAKEFVFNH